MKLPQQLQILANLSIVANKIQLISYDKELLRKMELCLLQHNYEICEQLVARLTEEPLQQLFGQLLKHNFIPEAAQKLCYILYKDCHHLNDYSFLALPIRRLQGDELLHFVKYFYNFISNYRKFARQGLRVITDAIQLIIAATLEYAGVKVQQDVYQVLDSPDLYDVQLAKGVARRAFKTLFNNEADTRSLSQTNRRTISKALEQENNEKLNAELEARESRLLVARSATIHNSLSRPVDEIIQSVQKSLVTRTVDSKRLAASYRFERVPVELEDSLSRSLQSTGISAKQLQKSAKLSNFEVNSAASIYDQDFVRPVYEVLPKFHDPVTQKSLPELADFQDELAEATNAAVKQRLKEVAEKRMKYIESQHNMLLSQKESTSQSLVSSQTAQSKSSVANSVFLTNHRASQILVFIDNCFE